MTGRSYKASGKYTFGGAMLLLIGGLLGGFVLGASYIYLLGIVANMLLRCLVVVGFVAAMTGWLLFLTRRAKIRNTRVVLLLTGIVLFLTNYSSWVFYILLVFDSWQKGLSEVWSYHLQFPLLLQRWAELFINPAAVIESMAEILPFGFVSINGAQLKDIPLLITWFAEFLLLFFVPLYQVVYRAGCPFDEDKQVWLPVKEEWTISYVEDYREVRNSLRRKDTVPLENALDKINYYQVQGLESYAIMEFYRKGKLIGPYVTITNVKAVQVGPRKLVHRAISVVKKIDIGSEAATDIYRRIEQGYRLSEKNRPKFKVGSKQAWEDRMSSLSFNLSRKTKNITSELKNSTKVSKSSKHSVNGAEGFSDTQRFNTEEIPAALEEITVHVPRVTPEMEKEYLNRNKR